MLSASRLGALFVAALIVVGAAAWMAHRRDLPSAGPAGSEVLPGVAQHLGEVSEVRVVTAGDVTAVTLRKLDDKHWGVMERAGYAADQQKLSRLLMNLKDLKVVEEKTAVPANYARLGVEDVKGEKATGARVDLLGLKEPASLIVGSMAGARGSYVRPAGSATSVLAEPQVSVERVPSNWLDRRVLDVATDRVQEVRITAGKASPYVVTREQPGQADFAVANLPKGHELSSPSAANTAAGALADLTMDDVRAASAGSPPQGETSHAEYRLFDGTVITLTGTKAGNDHWLAIAVAFDEAQFQRFAPKPAAPAENAAPAGAGQPMAPAVPAASAVTPATLAGDAEKPATAPRTVEQARQETETLAHRADGWLYKVPAYKFETLFQPIDDLLKKP